MNTAMIEYQDVQQSMLPAGTTDAMLVDMWLARKKSIHTRRAYQQDVAHFLRFLGGKPLQSINLQDVQTYQQSLSVKQNTINRKLVSMKSLLSFAQRTGHIRFNVGTMVELKQPTSGLSQRILTEEQIIKMVALETNPRNHALLRLLYHAGLRVSEVINLHWSDCIAREVGGQITVIGKGNKERHILIGAGFWDELMQLKSQSVGPEVFTSRGNGKSANTHLSQPQVFNIVRAAARRAGIDADVSPHWLRHAHVSHALTRGAPINLVMDTVGHASMATTSIYAHARPDTSSSSYMPL